MSSTALLRPRKYNDSYYPASADTISSYKQGVTVVFETEKAAYVENVLYNSQQLLCISIHVMRRRSAHGGVKLSFAAVKTWPRGFVSSTPFIIT